jgi:hypothetical protein
MTFVGHLNLLTGNLLKVLLTGFCKERFDLLIQQAMIFLQCESIVAMLLDNLILYPSLRVV